jgi:hypothetical protein
MPTAPSAIARAVPAALLALAAGAASCGGDDAAARAALPPRAGVEERPVSAFRFRSDPRVRTEIPLDRIVKGIPRKDPKDGIPAIREPRSVAAAEANHLRDADPVVAVEVGGGARAYPVRMLDRHEVVNDELGGVPIAVTYCPLCDSALVVRRDPDLDPAREGERVTLGVSGYLFDSDVLLYDAETETFWQQILGRGVVGPHAGRVLEPVPSFRTTWGAWRAAKPHTTALSWRTEHAWASTEYETPHYVEYRASNRFRFPVERYGKELPPREQVFGLSHGGKHLAVPARALEGRREPLDVTVGGKAFRLVPEPHLSTWRADAPGAGPSAGSEPVPLLRSYWFAWSAFHPESEVLEPAPR